MLMDFNGLYYLWGCPVDNSNITCDVTFYDRWLARSRLACGAVPRCHNHDPTVKANEVAI